MSRAEGRGRPKHPLTREVREIWAANRRHWKSAAGVHRRTQEIYGDLSPSLRKVQEIVREASQGIGEGDESRNIQTWSPWDGSVANVAYLLRIAEVSQSVTGEPLGAEDAKWAARLERPTHGLHLLARYLLAREYATREKVAGLLGDDHPHTSDLDRWLTWRPWTHRNRYLDDEDIHRTISGFLSVNEKPINDSWALITWLGMALSRSALEVDVGEIRSAEWWPEVSALNEVEEESSHG
jgi:hypothetical protein